MKKTKIKTEIRHLTKKLFKSDLFGVKINKDLLNKNQKQN